MKVRRRRAARILLLNDEGRVLLLRGGDPASPALHLRAGFVEVGTLRRVGFKQDRWVDTLLLQLSLEDPPL